MILQYIFLALYIYLDISFATFTDDFNTFLQKTYGSEVQQKLERVDMGPGIVGSFGGKERANMTFDKRPIIFVHGALLTAGFYLSHVDFFKHHGYGTHELYATTYNKAFATKLLDVPVTCEVFKQIRLFIEAVHKYSNMKVDIIAYSLGVLITRKAILGGICFDTNENLGPTITNMVETFVSVGGVAYGLQDCDRKRPACNDLSSMYCGSLLLRELNSVGHRFEAAHTYAVYSFDDRVLGVRCCNHTCGILAHAEMSIGFPGLDHLTVASATKLLQFGALNHPTAHDVLASARMFLDGTRITTSDIDTEIS